MQKYVEQVSSEKEIRGEVMMKNCFNKLGKTLKKLSGIKIFLRKKKKL